jgi:hypothetical protein
MRSRTRRLLAGVVAFGLSYLLTAVVAFPWADRLVPASPEAPYWVAVGWILLAAHGAEIVVAQPGAISHTNPVFDAGFQWLLLVPTVASFLVGLVTLRTSHLSAPRPTRTGTYLAVGYLAATVASFAAFRTSVATGAGTTVTAGPDVLSALWVLPAVLVPLVFGFLGAWVAKSPLLASLPWSASTDDAR